MTFLKKIFILACIFVMAQQATAYQVWTAANDILFTKNSAIDLNETEIRKIQLLVKTSQQRAIRVLIIVGHADPSEKNQRPLALARARRVEQLFIQLGMKASFIHTEAKAATDPVFTTSDTRNQRVEIEAIGEHLAPTGMFTVPNQTEQPPIRP